MRIDVIARGEPGQAQVRAYAEYRLFATLTPHTQRVRSARIVLRRDPAGASQEIVCSVTVKLEPSGSIRMRANGTPASAAIDRAAECIGRLMARSA
jgi:hypothetical protein